MAFAGSRHSDHVAMLAAFQGWEGARGQGERAEVQYCDARGLNMPTMRVTWEAKRQLVELLVQAGFPETSFLPREFVTVGQDSTLDLVTALLTLGLYPNVCMHREKRKVLTTEAKTALIHKGSVNCLKEAATFPLPFFVFNEKIRTRAVSCKSLTMVSPIHLLLFGARRVDLLPEGIVRWVAVVLVVLMVMVVLVLVLVVVVLLVTRLKYLFIVPVMALAARTRYTPGLHLEPGIYLAARPD